MEGPLKESGTLESLKDKDKYNGSVGKSILEVFRITVVMETELIGSQMDDNGLANGKTMFKMVSDVM